MKDITFSSASNQLSHDDLRGPPTPKKNLLDTQALAAAQRHLDRLNSGSKRFRRLNRSS